MPTAADLPVLHCASKADWARWLAENHAGAPGVWLQLARKGAAVATVSYDEAIEVALCYGLDRQPEAGAGRAVLAAAVHATPRGRRLVGGQPREGHSAD